MAKKPIKQAVPNILPREPLTKKARAAIECYTLSVNLYTINNLREFCGYTILCEQD